MRYSRQSIFTRAAWVAPLIAAAGCTVGPNYRPPQPVQTPAEFGVLGPPTTAPSTAPSTEPAVITSQPVAVAEWWATLNDPLLDELAQRAIESSLDVKLATARLREARARRAVITGADLPTANVTGGYSHERISHNAQPFGSVAGGGIPFEWDLYQAGFDASWELDVFGGTRRAVEAANADLAASAEDRRFIMLSTVSEVARNYVELRGFQRELDVAERNLQVQRQTIDLTRNLWQRGISTQLDVSRAVAQASNTEAQIPALQRQEWQAIHRIAVLLGQEPSSLAQRLSTRSPIPMPPNKIPVGVPSDLLRRRPDVRRAERQFAGATARVGIAVADLFPKFTLNGSIGLQSAEAGTITNIDSRVFNFGPSVSWPIFDAGKLRALVHVRNAQQEQALVQYQQTVLRALSEVEDAIVALKTEQARAESLSASVNANSESADLADSLYRQGLADFLTVLDAQRSLYDSQDKLAISQQTVTLDLIALYKALGGGWEVEPMLPVAAPTVARAGTATGR